MAQNPQPRASWPSGDDDAGFNLIVIAVGVSVGGYLLWSSCHAAISALVIALAHHEIGFIGRFTDRDTSLDRWLMAADPRAMTFRDLVGMLRSVGMFFRVPAAAFIALLAAVCAVRAAPARFTRKFDLESLIREQARSFPIVAAFVGRRLRLVPPASEPRPADYALTAQEWVGLYALDADGAFNETRARQALIAQLGPAWSGPRVAAPVVRFMFAVFGLHLAERREEALALLGRASAALPKPGGDEPGGPDAPLGMPPGVIAEADHVLADAKALEAAEAVAARHAYTATALMGLLNAARMHAGVLAPGQFAWLKLVDRGLWYALHSLGFESEAIGRYLHPNPRVEAAGARDHWAMEQAIGGPVRRPSVDYAYEAVRRAAPVQPVTPVPA